MVRGPGCTCPDSIGREPERPLGSGFRSQEAPAVSGEAFKDNHGSVRLFAWFAVEPHAPIAQAAVGRVEVVNAQEERDPSGTLLSDAGALVFAVGTGQEETGLRPPRGLTTTQRFGRPSFVVAGVSSVTRK